VFNRLNQLLTQGSFVKQCECLSLRILRIILLYYDHNLVLLSLVNISILNTYADKILDEVFIISEVYVCKVVVFCHMRYWKYNVTSCVTFI